MELQYTDKIGVKDYNMLRTAVNWRALDEEQAAAGMCQWVEHKGE